MLFWCNQNESHLTLSAIFHHDKRFKLKNLDNIVAFCSWKIPFVMIIHNLQRSPLSISLPLLKLSKYDIIIYRLKGEEAIMKTVNANLS